MFEQLAIDAQENDHQIDVAIGWARRHLALDPLAEVAQQRLMRLLAAKGDRAAALAEYARFRDRLASELRVAPSAQTRRLAEDLALGPAASGSRSASTFARFPWWDGSRSCDGCSLPGSGLGTGPAPSS